MSPATDHSPAGPNPVGVHCLVWSATTTQEILDVIPLARQLGYDGIEVPILAPGQLDLPAIRAALDDAGIACTASTAIPPGLSLIDDSTCAATVRFLAAVITETAALGASVLCGPMAAPIGEQRGRGSIPAEWESCVSGLREAGQVAALHGVDLAFEPLNRFETFVVNTVADGVRLVQEVDQPSVGLLLDTFHMNVEEKSIPQAIASAAGYIKHFHCSENDRGTVGTGHVPWIDVFSQMQAIGYPGWLTLESFGGAVPEIAAATSIWRPLARSQDDLARESLEYIRKEMPHP